MKTKELRPNVVVLTTGRGPDRRQVSRGTNTFGMPRTVLSVEPGLRGERWGVNFNDNTWALAPADAHWQEA